MRGRKSSCSVSIIAALVMALLQSPAAAQPPGVFVAVGEMTRERWDHTATLLPDGTVLIVGGSSSSAGMSSSAEIYDPSTATFRPTGSMRADRAGHTATLLATGKVLVAGGTGQTTAELYDPVTATFSETGPLLAVIQFGHAATLLPTGQVLLVGGSSATSEAPPRAQLYDPITGTFSWTGPEGSSNFFSASWPTANLLADGRVLVVGRNPAEIYDPLTNSFALTGRLVSRQYEYGLYWHTSTQLEDGTVLVAGGYDEWNCSPFNAAEIYDPSSRSFKPIAPMPTSRDLHTATRLRDGRVLITGGGTGGCGTPTNDGAELYDPVNRSFVNAGYMTARRFAHTATLLKDGTVLITGGSSYWPRTVLKSAELYQPANTSTTFMRLPDDPALLPNLIRKLLANGSERSSGASPTGAATAFLLPAVGTVNGSGGRLFRTDVTLANARSTAQDIMVAWLAQGNLNGPSVPAFRATLPPLSSEEEGGTLTIEDLADELGVHGLGSMVVVAVDSRGDVDEAAKIEGFARVRSPASCGSGSVSQSLPAVTSSGFGPHPRGRALGLRHDSTNRTNVGIVNLDEQYREFTVTVAGELHAERFVVTVPPFAMVQAALPDRNYGSVALTISSEGGPWAAYGSSVDNASGDAWASLAAPRR